MWAFLKRWVLLWVLYMAAMGWSGEAADLYKESEMTGEAETIQTKTQAETTKNKRVKHAQVS